MADERKPKDRKVEDKDLSKIQGGTGTSFGRPGQQKGPQGQSNI